jgi:hypothetical protein
LLRAFSLSTSYSLSVVVVAMVIAIVVAIAVLVAPVPIIRLVAMVQAIVIAIFPAIVRLAIPLPVVAIFVAIPIVIILVLAVIDPLFFSRSSRSWWSSRSCARNASGAASAPIRVSGHEFNSSRKELILSGALARAHPQQSPASHGRSRCNIPGTLPGNQCDS